MSSIDEYDIIKDPIIVVDPSCHSQEYYDTPEYRRYLRRLKSKINEAKMVGRPIIVISLQEQKDEALSFVGKEGVIYVSKIDTIDREFYEKICGENVVVCGEKDDPCVKYYSETMLKGIFNKPNSIDEDCTYR